jgi:hypothetical protein
LVIAITKALDSSGDFHAIKVLVMGEFDALTDFGRVVLDFAQKKVIQLGLKTLEYVRRYYRTSLMIAQFVRLPQQCLDPSIALASPIPISKLSLRTCLEIKSSANSVPPLIPRNLVVVFSLFMGTLPCRIIPFPQILRPRGPPLLADEPSSCSTT